MLRPMSRSQAHLVRLARRTAAGIAMALTSLAATAAPGTAPAAPAAAASAPSDAVERFLGEQRLLGAVSSVAVAEAGFAAQVRDKASDMVLTALSFLGVPYRRGGNSTERGFDCSGFTRQVFSTSLGLALPRRVDEQARAPGLTPIKRDELQPGDLVFFNTLRRTFSHVGIYMGEGKYIHSPRPGGEVRVEDMRFSYWAKRFTGARRADPIALQALAEVPAAPALPTAAEAAPTIH